MEDQTEYNKTYQQNARETPRRSSMKNNNNWQQNLQDQLQDPNYAQFSYEYTRENQSQQYYNNQNKKKQQQQHTSKGLGLKYKRGSRSSTHSEKKKLPIEDYELDNIGIKVHVNQETQEETVVVIKRTMKTFIYHADDYYRDKGSKRNNYVNEDKPEDKDLKKFHKHRYYLFSKFDRGVKIDDESWYSITPENISKHVANKISSIYGEGNANAMDGFSGVGGNLIQLARKCGFCVGNDNDPTKCEYARHNATIYGVDKKIQFIYKDFLQLKIEDIQYPQDRSSKIDVVFISPPWGGIGYNLLDEYKTEYLFPDFKQVIKKTLEFSNNMIAFLPKNTSIDDIIDCFATYANEFNEDPENRKNELILEIEQIVYGNSCKGIHIYTGQLAKVDPKEVADYFYRNYCQSFNQSDESYLKVILGNIFTLCGYKHFVQYFKTQPGSGSKISLSKVIKKIQKKFSEDEWHFLKKYHKRSRTNSKKSSTLSHASNVSMEEEKQFNSRTHSETSSIASAKKSNTSIQKRLSKAEKLARKFADKYDLEEEQQQKENEQMSDGEGQKQKAHKKVVHFGDTEGHIELKDLSQKDFIELVEAKNQDKRFYGWLHFGPIFQDHKEIKADPTEDIEYFRQLYDNNFFNSQDNIMEDEVENKSHPH